jgi:hypothetical protein
MIADEQYWQVWILDLIGQVQQDCVNSKSKLEGDIDEL